MPVAVGPRRHRGQQQQTARNESRIARMPRASTIRLRAQSGRAGRGRRHGLVRPVGRPLRRLGSGQDADDRAQDRRATVELLLLKPGHVRHRLVGLVDQGSPQLRPVLHQPHDGRPQVERRCASATKAAASSSREASTIGPRLGSEVLIACSRRFPAEVQVPRSRHPAPQSPPGSHGPGQPSGAAWRNRYPSAACAAEECGSAVPAPGVPGIRPPPGWPPDALEGAVERLHLGGRAPGWRSPPVAGPSARDRRRDRRREPLSREVFPVRVQWGQHGGKLANGPIGPQRRG